MYPNRRPAIDMALENVLSTIRFGFVGKSVSAVCPLNS